MNDENKFASDHSDVESRVFAFLQLHGACSASVSGEHR